MRQERLWGQPPDTFGTPRVRSAAAACDQLTQRIPQGSVIKCFAVYNRPFWREQGLNGFVTNDVEPVHLVFDNSPPDGSIRILLGFIEGRSARQLIGMPTNQ